MATLVNVQGKESECHCRTYCGTISKLGTLWDVYTLGFCSVASTGKPKVLLETESQLFSFISASEILAWVVEDP